MKLKDQRRVVIKDNMRRRKIPYSECTFEKHLTKGAVFEVDAMRCVVLYVSYFDNILVFDHFTVANIDIALLLALDLYRFQFKVSVCEEVCEINTRIKIVSIFTRECFV